VVPNANDIQANELSESERKNADEDSRPLSQEVVIVLADDNADMRDYLARLLGGH
jgi:hypothetical protein